MLYSNLISGLWDCRTPLMLERISPNKWAGITTVFQKTIFYKYLIRKQDSIDLEHGNSRVVIIEGESENITLSDVFIDGPEMLFTKNFLLFSQEGMVQLIILSQFFDIRIGSWTSDQDRWMRLILEVFYNQSF